MANHTVPIRRLIQMLLLASTASLTLCDFAVANPVTTTEYVFYEVAGGTAAEIYESMLSQAPHVNGVEAHAATLAESSQSGKFEQTDSCRIQDYQYAIKFTIRLPRLSEKDIPPKVISRWQQFTQFLKKHEETHRSIWIECANDIEKEVRSLRATSCAEVDRLSQEIVDRVQKACNRKHTVFDEAEQKRLSKHPFVKLAFTHANRERAALAIGKRKKKPAIKQNFN